MSGAEVIAKTLRRYRLLKITEITLTSATAASLIFALSDLVLGAEISISLSVLTGFVIFAWRYKVSEIQELDHLQISHFLNREFPHLRDSTDLLVKPVSTLTSLELIQKKNIDKAVANLQDIKLPHQLPTVASIFLVALILSVGLSIFQNNKPITPLSEKRLNTISATTDSTASITEYHVTVRPPQYSGLTSVKSEELNIRALSGSVVVWTFEMSDTSDNLMIKLSTGEKLNSEKQGKFHTIRHTINRSDLYQVAWSYHGNPAETEYYRMDALPDHPPQVTIEDLQQFTRLDWGEKNEINFRSKIQDDFSVSAANIIATVSKGSGESVKFREERLAFDRPSSIGGKEVTGFKNINFSKLGMEPGDELYFYVEVYDNKRPLPQRARTETYFIALRDTAQVSLAISEGMSVDLMPDYFRSQRQIIIDTEKLLAEKNKLSKQQFNQTSNELGYDQKVLRLKYGQFLGEEFETTTGPTGSIDNETATDEEGLIEEFGHQHDTENEHNLVPVQNEKDESSEIKNEFGHSHDNTDEATFFTQSIKAKLRAALTLMWDSELQLRLYHPAESLPYQYQILKLLKEISQDSRIYVHRMGFDPPPIKEEKRLTADLKEITTQKYKTSNEAKNVFPAIKECLTSISLHASDYSYLRSEFFQQQLQRAGEELAHEVVKNPGLYITQLSDIKSIKSQTLSDQALREIILSLQKVFERLVPAESLTPSRKGTTMHSYDRKLLEELKKSVQ